MDLYSYISIKSLLKDSHINPASGIFNWLVPNLMYVAPEADVKYGLSLVRDAIILHEEQKGILIADSKREIPFFRNNRRMLVGPEMEMYALSLFENSENPAVTDPEEPYLRFTFDYEALGDYCLSENRYLLRCKYDEEKNRQSFLAQMEQEYDKFFFDDEHTGFTRDSRFFSMLCNACLEVKSPDHAAEKEWRMVSFCDPASASYDFIEGCFLPFVVFTIPFSCIKRITLLHRERHLQAYSTLAGFLQHIGLVPERYLEGMIEE